MKGTDLEGEEPDSRAEAVVVVQVPDGVAWTDGKPQVGVFINCVEDRMRDSGAGVGKGHVTAALHTLPLRRL